MKFDKIKGLAVYGDTAYRNKNCPKETLEQVTFFSEARKRWPDTVGILATHIKNEGQRSWVKAARDKAEGMHAGTADIIIVGNPSLVIEMKRRDHTLCQWQKGQPEYLQAAINNGAMAVVALGYEAALEAVEDWMAGRFPNG